MRGERKDEGGGEEKRCRMEIKRERKECLKRRNEEGLAGRQVINKDVHGGSSYAHISDIIMTSSYLDTLPCWVGVHAVVNVVL